MNFVLHERARSVDQRRDSGPFDIIGDVHGCADELEDLLRLLGYVQTGRTSWQSPTGRTPVFVGDLVDRGPRIADALRIAMAMVQSGTGLCVPGNHDLQLAKELAGEDVPIVYGLEDTVEQLTRETPTFRAEVLEFLTQIKGHYVFDAGRLVVSHTGLPAHLQGVDTDDTRQLSTYGVTEGDIDPSDPHKRHAWVADYRGTANVVYGHTKVVEAVWQNNSIDIDTGCVFGWKLTALRWPERELVAVRAKREYVRSERFRSRWQPKSRDHHEE
jgi:protein phosphatase